MNIPSRIVDEIADLETRAAMLRREGAHDLARQLLNTAVRLRAAIAAEEDTLLSPEQAVAYSGYNRSYLMRHLHNYGRRSNPLYRKGDLPRKLQHHRSSGRER